MPVTEVLMGSGSFDVNFKEDAPWSIRHVFSDENTNTDYGFLGYLIVTRTRLPAELLSLSALLANSRYTGIMTSRRRRGIGGFGLLWHYERLLYGDFTVSNTFLLGAGSNSFSTWITDIVNTTVNGNPGPLTLGTVTAIAGSLEWYSFYDTRKEGLDFVCEYFGGEYEVTPQALVNAGPASSLFLLTPNVVVLPRGGTRDLDRAGLQTLRLDEDNDVEQTANLVVVPSQTPLTFGVAHFYGSIIPLDLNGNEFPLHHVEDAPSQGTGSSGETARASAVLTEKQDNRRQVTVKTADYDPGGSFGVGDAIYVYDPDQFLFDLGNQIQHGGQTIFPVSQRVLGMTWPLQDGMGVYYYRGRQGDVTDLSDYVVWEEPGVDVSVGALPRLLTEDKSKLSLLGRIQ